jgi:hypothetical protein
MGINLRVEGIRRVLSTICSVAGTISAVAESERKSTLLHCGFTRSNLHRLRRGCGTYRGEESLTQLQPPVSLGRTALRDPGPSRQDPHGLGVFRPEEVGRVGGGCSSSTTPPPQKRLLFRWWKQLSFQRFAHCTTFHLFVANIILSWSN